MIYYIICILTTYLYSVSIHVLFIRLTYTNTRLMYRKYPYLAIATLTYFIHELFGHSNNAMMAQNSKSQNDVRSLQQYYPNYLGHFSVSIIWHDNAKMGKHSTSQNHVKSIQGYSPKYTEHVFSVIGFNLPGHGLDDKLRQNHKLRWWSFLICRTLWLSQFMRIQNTTSQINVQSPGGLYL